MPYREERASKGGHSDLVRNPDVSGFLGQCDYITEPTLEEAEKIASTFENIDVDEDLPLKVVASDASPYSDPINGMFPSTQVGYVKVSLVLIDVNDYSGLSKPGTRFVDPFKVAEMHRNADAISFVLPGANVKYKSAATVADGFRRAVWEQLSDHRTQMANDVKFNVASTLLAIEDSRTITIEKCPSCGESEEFLFANLEQQHHCKSCGEEVFLTDSLRLHEQMSEYGDNTSSITRFMNVIEHLTMATLIRMLGHHQPESLSSMSFLIDGPLAIFGQPARIHARLMQLYFKIGQYLQKKGLPTPVILGIQKSGQAAEHAKSISRYLKPGSIKIIDDDYRARWIKGSDSKTDNFGHETYYGQDFIYKTPSGKIFTLALPYPYEKKFSRTEFAVEKAKFESYSGTLSRALKLIQFFELELYEDAVVPVALAHRHASISLVPGGKVLDLVTKHGLNVKK